MTQELPKILVIGIGDDGWEGLTAPIQQMIVAADVLVGGARHIALVPDHHQKTTIVWRAPIADTVPLIEQYRAKKMVILASGEPLWHGIGTLILSHFGADQVIIHPHVGAFSLAAAAMGWSLDQVEMVSLCGRDAVHLDRYISANQRLLVLCSNGQTGAEVSKILVQRGFGMSNMIALSNLGGAASQRTSFLAKDGCENTLPALTTLAIEVVADGPNAIVRNVLPGLPDEQFEHDGKITKCEVRAITLAKLQPQPGQLLWDVGAGAGSIAVEWLRAHPRNRAIAIEHDPQRLTMIDHNRQTFGVPHMNVVEGRAPAVFTQLEIPDAIFVGGGLSDPVLLTAAIERLKTGGRLVANAVTLQGEAALLAAFERWGGELGKIQIQRAEKVGPYFGWKSLMPVCQWSWVKR